MPLTKTPANGVSTIDNVRAEVRNLGEKHDAHARSVDGRFSKLEIETAKQSVALDFLVKDAHQRDQRDLIVLKAEKDITAEHVKVKREHMSGRTKLLIAAITTAGGVVTAALTYLATH